MKKFTIKLILSVLIFTTVFSNTSLAFAENSSEENLEISNEISQEFADTKYIDGNIKHELIELESDDDTISYQVDVEEEFGIENDSFEMHVDEFSDSEILVKSDLQMQDSLYGSNLYVNLDTGEFYVTEEEINDNGEKVVTTYDVFLTEIEGEEFKAQLVDRAAGELYEVNTIEAHASAIPVIGIIIANGVRWAVKKFGKKALVSAFGKAALSNAIKKAAKFSVSKKHLSNAGGRYTKFNTTSQSTVRSWVKEALQKNPSIKFNENYDKLSFTITSNVGKKVGTKGETKIKVVFDYTGKIWTAYPAK
ncbi:SAR2788 family putative toxin [Oceanobacillus polygoni]|uniref:Uncharacterized protein n=1 Tax=Oceanobacillus polygoni TaxID=1235259 RepID=A0A9X0YTD8_9BACI|nr:SAR2788 family putative toxin [Oceanobacillus polygoni]MBP2076955.1 hypothetical protein [Oceanobacillus polygoni]